MGFYLDIEAINFLKGIDFGEVFFDTVIRDSITYPCFFVKEKKKTIDLIGDSPDIQTFNINEDINNVLISALFFKFRDIKTDVYELIINSKGELSKEFIDIMISSNKFIMALFNENMEENIIEIDNKLKDTFKEIKEKSETYNNWSNDEFFEAKDIFFKKHPNIG